ncbi:MAG: hypothetical protein K6E31_08665 [bacterium]|nr:hypothetical protein [bacterium]
MPSLVWSGFGRSLPAGLLNVSEELATLLTELLAVLQVAGYFPPFSFLI